MARISFAEVARRLDQLDPAEAIREEVEANPTPLTDLVKEQLYQEGKDADGKQLTYTNPTGYYARLKNRMNPAPGLGNADLKKTGATYEQMKVDVSGSSYDITSTTPYTPYLFKRFGLKIMSLSQDSKIQYANGHLRAPLQRAMSLKMFNK